MKQNMKQNMRPQRDERPAIAAWELAERPFKMLVLDYISGAVEDAKMEGSEVPPKYLKHLRMAKMSKTLARRMDKSSLLKIPSQSKTVEIEQTPNEDNKRPWLFKLELVPSAYQIDRDVPKKFAEVLVAEHQEAAEEQLKITMSSIYSSVTQVYDDLRFKNADLMNNLGLLVNAAAGTYAIASPDFPKYKHPTHLGLVVTPDSTKQ